MDTKRQTDLTEEELEQVRKAMEDFGNIQVMPVVEAEVEQEPEQEAASQLQEEQKPCARKRLTIPQKWKAIIALVIVAAVIATITVPLLKMKLDADLRERMINHPNSMAKRNRTVAVSGWDEQIAAVRDDGGVSLFLDEYYNGEGKWLDDVFRSNVVSVELINHGTGDGSQTAFLNEDGTVTYSGDAKNVSDDWTDVKMVALGPEYIIGLHGDGTVSAAGTNEYGACDVSGWQDVIGIAATSCYAAGLRADGTVVVTNVTYPKSYPAIADNIRYFAEMNAWVEQATHWEQIVAISANSNFMVGLKADGTVVFAGNKYYNLSLDDAQWTDITAIHAENDVVVGIRSDGSVIMSGNIGAAPTELTQEMVTGLTKHLQIVDVCVAGYALYLLSSEGILYRLGLNSNALSEGGSLWVLEEVLTNVKLP